MMIHSAPASPNPRMKKDPQMVNSTGDSPASDCAEAKHDYGNDMININDLVFDDKGNAFSSSNEKSVSAQGHASSAQGYEFTSNALSTGENNMEADPTRGERILPEEYFAYDAYGYRMAGTKDANASQVVQREGPLSHSQPNANGSHDSHGSHGNGNGTSCARLTSHSVQGSFNESYVCDTRLIRSAEHHNECNSSHVLDQRVVRSAEAALRNQSVYQKFSRYQNYVPGAQGEDHSGTIHGSNYGSNRNLESWTKQQGSSAPNTPGIENRTLGYQSYADYTHMNTPQGLSKTPGPPGLSALSSAMPSSPLPAGAQSTPGQYLTVVPKKKRGGSGASPGMPIGKSPCGENLSNKSTPVFAGKSASGQGLKPNLLTPMTPQVVYPPTPSPMTPTIEPLTASIATLAESELLRGTPLWDALITKNILQDALEPFVRELQLRLTRDLASEIKNMSEADMAEAGKIGKSKDDAMTKNGTQVKSSKDTPVPHTDDCSIATPADGVTVADSDAAKSADTTPKTSTPRTADTTAKRGTIPPKEGEIAMAVTETRETARYPTNDSTDMINKTISPGMVNQCKMPNVMQQVRFVLAKKVRESVKPVGKRTGESVSAMLSAILEEGEMMRNLEDAVLQGLLKRTVFIEGHQKDEQPAFTSLFGTVSAGSNASPGISRSANSSPSMLGTMHGKQNGTSTGATESIHNITNANGTTSGMNGTTGGASGFSAMHGMHVNVLNKDLKINPQDFHANFLSLTMELNSLKSSMLGNIQEEIQESDVEHASASVAPSSTQSNVRMPNSSNASCTSSNAVTAGSIAAVVGKSLVTGGTPKGSDSSSPNATHPRTPTHGSQPISSGVASSSCSILVKQTSVYEDAVSSEELLNIIVPEGAGLSNPPSKEKPGISVMDTNMLVNSLNAAGNLLNPNINRQAENQPSMNQFVANQTAINLLSSTQVARSEPLSQIGGAFNQMGNQMRILSNLQNQQQMQNSLNGQSYSEHNIGMACQSYSQSYSQQNSMNGHYQMNQNGQQSNGTTQWGMNPIQKIPQGALHSGQYKRDLQKQIQIQQMIRARRDPSLPQNQQYGNQAQNQLGQNQNQLGQEQPNRNLSVMTNSSYCQSYQDNIAGSQPMNEKGNSGKGGVQIQSSRATQSGTMAPTLLSSPPTPLAQKEIVRGNYSILKFTRKNGEDPISGSVASVPTTAASMPMIATKWQCNTNTGSSSEGLINLQDPVYNELLTGSFNDLKQWTQTPDNNGQNLSANAYGSKGQTNKKQTNKGDGGTNGDGKGDSYGIANRNADSSYGTGDSLYDRFNSWYQDGKGDHPGKGSSLSKQKGTGFEYSRAGSLSKQNGNNNALPATLSSATSDKRSVKGWIDYCTQEASPSAAIAKPEKINTEPCRHWETLGNCRLGDKCAFYHDPQRCNINPTVLSKKSKKKKRRDSQSALSNARET